MLYAAYGSNLHPLRLKRRIPAVEFLGTAALSDYTLYFHKRSIDGSAKCSISQGSDGIHVAVYNLDEVELRQLDAIEGVGDGYDRIALQVPGFGACASYAASAGFIDDRLQPYDWYKEMVMLGCRFHGWPEAYIARIDAIGAVPDPDPVRSEANWAIVQSLRPGMMGA